MQEELEAELRMALAEGLITREEQGPLREEALRLGKSPMEVLKARGAITDESLADIRKSEISETFVPHADTDGAVTLGPALTLEDRDKADPAFPVPGWARYEGVRFLGQGGMGRVFLAYDRTLRRNVALKFVRGDDAELIRRLLTEARSQARVEHERVCQVHEVGEVQGKPYIAMQFVDGLPLDRLASELKLTVEQKVLVLREAAEGVHAAHRAGLIHRDLKPSNILVERTDDGRFKPFVMDFGLAHEWSEKGTISSGSAVGTPHYMAPEQARGEIGLDRRADVYSLGATLYFLLTGHQVIPGANGLEVLNNIATVEPTPPRVLNPNIPADLEAIILKCLEKDRSARYDSARAFIEDLDRFLAGEPVQARPTGLWYRLRKKALKHRVVVGVASTALLAVTLALGSALYTHSQATRREQLVRSLTEKVEHIEALARYSGLSPLHDTRADREEIRTQMAELEGQIREAGDLAVGPGSYALARGHLALGDEARARKLLEDSWNSGFRDPRVAYALSLVLGHLYQEQLVVAETLPTAPEREARKQDLQRLYRDPALEWLRQSQGADVPSSDYVAALIALYEERFDEALARLDKLGNSLPWFYEAPQLRGDVFRMRAAQRWNQGDLEGARVDLEEGRRAYSAAADIGESVPATYQSLARLEYTSLIIGLYSKGEVLPSFNRSKEALTRALQASPEDGASLMLAARLHRRLGEYQLSHGEDPQPTLATALAQASKALEHGHPGREVHMEKAFIFLFWGRSRMQHGQDPREQLRQAEQSLQDIPEDNRDYEFHSTLGLILSTWGEYHDQIGTSAEEYRQRAIESLQAATRLNPRLYEAWINLGRTFLHRSEATSPSTGASPRARQEEDLKQAWEALQHAMELNPRHLVPYLYGGRIHLKRARLHQCDGSATPLLTTAQEVLQKGLSINPNAFYLNDALGKVLLAQASQAWDGGGNPFPLLDKAQSTFAEVIRAAPQQAYGYNGLGLTYLSRATYKRARGEELRADTRDSLSALEQAAQRASESDAPFFTTDLGDIHSLLADLELERGRDPSSSLQRAETALRAALARNAQNARSWLLLGRTLGIQARWKARIGRATAADFEQSAQAFEKALALEPETPEVLLDFGALLHAQAVWEKDAGRVPAPQLKRGLALVDQILSDCPGWPPALLLRAKLQIGPGEPRGSH